VSRFIAAAVQSRLYYSLSPTTAAAVGLPFAEFQQAAIGRRALSDWKIQRLAAHFGITRKEAIDD
jgi:hypothetical protein